jgi:hypothetical protein
MTTPDKDEAIDGEAGTGPKRRPISIRCCALGGTADPAAPFAFDEGTGSRRGPGFRTRPG